MMTRLIFLAAVSAVILPAQQVEQYKPHDFSFEAQATGNPFDVELEAEFTGPKNQILRVAGFYDGANTWKVRFSAPEPGSWKMRTKSPVASLNGKTALIEATPNRNARLHGVLRVDQAHPYHFRFDDGTRFYLMGYEADWLWGADMLDPQRKLMHRLIEQIDGRGFNYVLVNVYAHDTNWCKGKANEWDFGPPALYAWEGTNEKPDHSRLNTRFFKIYDGMMEALHAKGMIAHIMLKVYNKNVNWPPAGSRDEARFFRYVVARYQAYPNIVWDFAKEAYNEKDEVLQKNLVDLVRAEDGYKHMVAVHDDDAYEWDRTLSTNIDFRVDQQHAHWEQMSLFDRAFRARPVVNVEFSYELGVEPLPTHGNINQVDWKEMLRRAWRIVMAGSYVAYYYNNTAWDIVKPDPEPPGHARWQLLRETMESVPYWRMDPIPALAAGGTCIADQATTWLCYKEADQPRPAENAIHLNLTSAGGPMRAEWINTWDGRRLPAGTLKPEVVKLRHPVEFGQTPALLLLRRE